MTLLVSLDPGKVTGCAIGCFTDTTPYERLDYFAIQGGLEGFIDFAESRWCCEETMSLWEDPLHEGLDPILISERFVLRSNAFVADTTPLLIEGAMAAWHLDPVYQLRSDKALVPDQILKDNGWWVTGKMCGWKDGRDVNDSLIHALVYLKRKKHEPTLRKLWPEESDARRLIDQNMKED